MKTSLPFGGAVIQLVIESGSELIESTYGIVAFFALGKIHISYTRVTLMMIEDMMAGTILVMTSWHGDAFHITGH